MAAPRKYPDELRFLVEQPNRRYLILDGQQRLKTLRDFVNGTDSVTERSFRLRNVSEDGPFYNFAFSELSQPDKDLLLNTFIQVTVVVPKRPGHLQGIYQLFERIDSGGTNLQPQEIRVALYAGSRVDALRQLNANEDWRALFGEPHSRLKDTELILRYLALRQVALRYQDVEWSRDAPREWLEQLESPEPVEVQEVYRAPLNQFLNGYLESLGEGGRPTEDDIQGFRAACSVLRPLGRSALRLDDSAQVNAAHADAVLVGLSLSPAIRRSGTMPLELSEGVRQALGRLEANRTYQIAVRESTSHLASVHSRLELATRAMENL